MQEHDVKRFCTMSDGRVPVLAEVDVIVVGGTIGGVAAAVKAAQEGAKVFLVGYQPYLGEDICGTYKYMFEPQLGQHPWLQELFPCDAPPTPLRVKKVLEDHLIDNEIGFLYSSYVTDVLLSASSKPAGVVISNRSGRQFIGGSVIVDATSLAHVTRMAGCQLTEHGGPEQEFSFITVGNNRGSQWPQRTLPLQPVRGDVVYEAHEYTFTESMTAWSHAELCRIEHSIRGKVWDADQVDSADSLYFIPPFTIDSMQPGAALNTDLGQLPLGVFRPRSVEGVYVLSGCVDIPREQASEFLRPNNLLANGERIGAEAAAVSQQLPRCAPQRRPETQPASEMGTLRHGAMQLRNSHSQGVVDVGATSIPVLAECDVVVVGGGTAGVNVGISAARHGAKTLVLEYLHSLGGTQNAGLIGRYWDGYREGYTKEIDAGVANMAPADHPRQKEKINTEWNFDWKIEWYRRELLTAGAEAWFGVLGCGALVHDNQVKGILVATPAGFGVILAHVIVDSSGSADIAVAAGAQYEYTGAQTVAVQGAGLPPVNLGDHYNNTDWTFIDDGDVYDVTRVFVSGKGKYGGAYDVGKLPQTRERRRLVGEHQVSVMDILNHRRYPDTISYHVSSFDTHGFTIDPFFTIKPPEERHTIYDADVPLRSLLPQELRGIVVTGLGASAHRDAMPVIRMQPCLQNQGYSVGYLSALAVKDQCDIRDVDIKQIQEHLVDRNILPQRVLADMDTFPLSQEQLAEAVAALGDGFSGLECVLTDPERAQPLLEEAYAKADGRAAKTTYAHVLCMLGVPDGVDDIVAAVDSYSEWDEGWDYTGLGQFGKSMSRLDSLIIALGEAKQAKALPAILAKAEQLTPTDAFSHFRAIALACEQIRDPQAAPVLRAILELPGVGGHHVTSLRQARDTAVPDPADVSIRNQVLKELHLARALYRCGDNDGQGEAILQNYAQDVHGHYYRHASAILAGQS